MKEADTSKPILEPRMTASKGLYVRSFIRRNVFLFLFTIIFLSAAILIFIQVDQTYFNAEKGEIIKNMIEDKELFPDRSRNELGSLVDQYNRYETRSTENIGRIEAIIDEIEAKMGEILDNNDFAWQVSFIDANDELVAQVTRKERIAQQNNYSNSLFFLDYSKTLSSIREYDSGKPGGIIEISHASPVGFQEIEDLTQKWRIRSLIIALILFGVYFVLLYGLILPIRRVTNALDKGPQVGARFIDPPRVLLDKYYNNLARDATLTVLSTTLRGLITNEGLMEREDILPIIPKLVSELFPAENIFLLTYKSEEKDGAFKLRTIYSKTEKRTVQSEADLQILPSLKDFPSSIDHHDSDEKIENLSTRHFITVVYGETTERSLLMIDKKTLSVRWSNWWESVFEDIATEIAFAIEKIEGQRRLILQEKNKANISLSRNLGHDLTNIIATSKLELMTVKSLLNMPREKVYESERKQLIFKESLESLLNSTRFLQETVNLYRSFTYLSRPRFEEVNINELASEVAQLFQLSLSRNISVDLDQEDDLPLITVEPRLIKLALFNLLSNAADSIKLASSADQPSGTIRLRTRKSPQPDFMIIDVMDTGTGVCDPSGRLLEAKEMDAIFQLGYTTKEQGTGEGLGLNWVFQIINDFHDGEIIVRNRKESGAIFSLQLPIRQRTEVSSDTTQRQSADHATP